MKHIKLFEGFTSSESILVLKAKGDWTGVLKPGSKRNYFISPSVYVVDIFSLPEGEQVDPSDIIKDAEDARNYIFDLGSDGLYIRKGEIMENFEDQPYALTAYITPECLEGLEKEILSFLNDPDTSNWDSWDGPTIQDTMYYKEISEIEESYLELFRKNEFSKKKLLLRNWSDENLRAESIKYDDYSEFSETPAYRAALNRNKENPGFLNEITQHMKKG